jgi:hypothetical protein
VPEVRDADSTRHRVALAESILSSGGELVGRSSLPVLLEQAVAQLGSVDAGSDDVVRIECSGQEERLALAIASWARDAVPWLCPEPGSGIGQDISTIVATDDRSVVRRARPSAPLSPLLGCFHETSGSTAERMPRAWRSCLATRCAFRCQWFTRSVGEWLSVHFLRGATWT